MSQHHRSAIAQGFGLMLGALLCLLAILGSLGLLLSFLLHKTPW